MQLLSQELKEKSIQYYEVEVPLEKVEDALAQSFRKVNQRLTIPGFRKGKATRAMVERLYGVEILYEEAIDILVPEVYEWILEEQKPLVLDRPSWDVTRFTKGESAVFIFEVAVKPVVTLGEYKGVAAYKKTAEITEVELDAEIRRLQDEHARLTTISEGVVEHDDSITLDYEGFIDGEAFEGGKGENYNLVIGSGRFIPGFEEALIGREIGAELEVEVTFPADYRAEELAGQEAVFKCFIKDAKRKQLLSVDDEFAQEISEFDTLDEWKADLQNNLTLKAEEDAENEYRNRILNKVISAANVDIPDVIVEREIDRHLQMFAYNLMRQGIDLEDYLRIIHREISDLRHDFRNTALASARRTLVLDAIAAAEEITPSDEEMHEFFVELAESMSSEDVAAVEERYRADEDQYAECLEEVRMRKTLELIASTSVALDEEPKEEVQTDLTDASVSDVTEESGDNANDDSDVIPELQDDNESDDMEKPEMTVEDEAHA